MPACIRSDGFSPAHRPANRHLNITLRGLEEYPDHNRSYLGKYLPLPCPKIFMEKMGCPISRKWGKKGWLVHSPGPFRGILGMTYMHERAANAPVVGMAARLLKPLIFQEPTEKCSPTSDEARLAWLKLCGLPQDVEYFSCMRI